MIGINLFFNFILAYNGFVGYMSNTPLLYVTFLKRTSAFYFLEDTLMEIFLYKRYEYVPHHLVALAGILNIREDTPTYPILLMYFCTESTSFVLNIRHVLKTHFYLPVSLDLTFFMYHNIMRNMVMTFVIYNLQEYKVLYYVGWAIQGMTYYWTYTWWKSIRNHQKKKSLL